MTISAKRLASGYWHIRGDGPCNWAQPPTWPCSESVLREHAFPEASEAFIRAAQGVRAVRHAWRPRGVAARGRRAEGAGAAVRDPGGAA